jgi:hypothetical protein
MPITKIILVIATVLLLTACGGGDCDSGPECEPELPPPGVDCKARPELCK